MELCILPPEQNEYHDNRVVRYTTFKIHTLDSHPLCHIQLPVIAAVQLNYRIYKRCYSKKNLNVKTCTVHKNTHTHTTEFIYIILIITMANYTKTNVLLHTQKEV